MSGTGRSASGVRVVYRVDPPTQAAGQGANEYGRGRAGNFARPEQQPTGRNMFDLRAAEAAALARAPRTVSSHQSLTLSNR
jgi:hypothetical protein